MSEEQIQYLDYVRPKRNNRNNRPEREVKVQPYKRYENTTIIQQADEIKMVKKQIKKQDLSLSIVVWANKLKIVVKFSKFEEEQADAIILPYLDAELNSYPCSVFKQELVLDQQKIKTLNFNQGELYLKGKKIYKYKFTAYIKIDHKENSSLNIQEGLKSLFELVVSKNIPINTIALVFAQEIFDLHNILLSLSKFENTTQRQFTIVFLVGSKQLLGKAWNILF